MKDDIADDTTWRRGQTSFLYNCPLHGQSSASTVGAQCCEHGTITGKGRPGIRFIVDVAYPYPEHGINVKGLSREVGRLLDKAEYTVVSVTVSDDPPMLDPEEWGPEDG